MRIKLPLTQIQYLREVPGFRSAGHILSMARPLIQNLGLLATAVLVYVAVYIIVTVQRKTFSTLHDDQRRRQLIMQPSDGISSSNMQNKSQSRLCGHVLSLASRSGLGSREAAG